MSVRYRRSAITLGALVILVSAAAFSLQRPVHNYLGYCAGTGRVLTDSEKLNIVVTLIATRDPGLVPIRSSSPKGEIVMGYKRPKQFLPYTSAQEFLQKNPDCCSVVSSTPDGATVSLWDRLTGRISAYVHARYRVPYLTDDGKVEEASFDEYHAITNCGHVWSGI
jgi:hypothetical protein